MGYSNYPDDIRSYDHDPRSPFYDDSHERAVEQALCDACEACPALFAQLDRLGLEESFEAEVEVEADEDGPYTCVTYRLMGCTVDESDFAAVAGELATLDREHPDLAEHVEACIP